MKVGDRVRYSSEFLDSIYENYGPIARARGTVLSLRRLGEEESFITGGPDQVLAQVKWDRSRGTTTKILASNLTVVEAVKRA